MKVDKIDVIKTTVGAKPKKHNHALQKSGKKILFWGLKNVALGLDKPMVAPPCARVQPETLEGSGLILFSGDDVITYFCCCPSKILCETMKPFLLPGFYNRLKEKRSPTTRNNKVFVFLQRCDDTFKHYSIPQKQFICSLHKCLFLIQFVYIFIHQACSTARKTLIVDKLSRPASGFPQFQHFA